MRLLRCSFVLIKKDGRFLFGLNKKGFSREKWTPLGGVVQPKEDLQTCALTSTKEQSGLTLEKLEKVGKIEIKLAGVQELIQMHIFIAESSGDVKEGRDMKLNWFYPDEIPYDSMWPDVVHWLPSILKGRKVKGFFVYENDALIYQDLNLNAFNNGRIPRSRSRPANNFRRGVLSR